MVDIPYNQTKSDHSFQIPHPNQSEQIFMWSLVSCDQYISLYLGTTSELESHQVPSYFQTCVTTKQSLVNNCLYL